MLNVRKFKFSNNINAKITNFPADTLGMVESSSSVSERRLSSVTKPSWLHPNNPTTHAFDNTPEEDNTTPSDEGENFQIHRDIHASNRNADSKF